MDPEHQYQPKYVTLNNNNTTNLRPPPHRRNIPRYHSTNHNSGGNCCLRCMCCCCCFWFVLIIVLAGTAIILYSILQPQPPVYNMDAFNVNAFDVQPDFSLYAEFAISVKAKNPNQHIGLTYGKGSLVIVSYQGSTLCSGQLPAFHQPHQNTTIIQVVLKGKSEFGSGLHSALTENRKTGKIPLLVKVKAPVSIVLVDYRLREIAVYINCSLVVDNLAPNKKAGILSSRFTYDIGI